MAMDPAVLWYWNDWHGATVTFSRHLKGCYMDLLHAQFNNGRLTLAEIKTVLGTDFGPSWPVLQKKFKEENGTFFNARLEKEIEKRKNFSKHQSENARKRWDKPGNTTAYAKDKPLENEIENEDVEGVKRGSGGERGTKYRYDDVTELPVIKLQSAQQLLKIGKGIDATEDQILGLWEIFRVQNLTGEKWYSSKNEVFSHFINWIKNQHVNGSKPFAKSAKTAGAYELLEKLKRAGAAGG